MVFKFLSRRYDEEYQEETDTINKLVQNLPQTPNIITYNLRQKRIVYKKDKKNKKPTHEPLLDEDEDYTSHKIDITTRYDLEKRLGVKLLDRWDHVTDGKASHKIWEPDESKIVLRSHCRSQISTNKENIINDTEKGNDNNCKKLLKGKRGRKPKVVEISSTEVIDSVPENTTKDASILQLEFVPSISLKEENEKISGSLQPTEENAVVENLQLTDINVNNALKDIENTKAIQDQIILKEEKPVVVIKEEMPAVEANNTLAVDQSLEDDSDVEIVAVYFILDN